MAPRDLAYLKSRASFCQMPPPGVLAGPVEKEESVGSLSKAAAVFALEHNLAAAFRALSTSLPGGRFHESPELCWSLTQVPYAAFNTVFAAHLEPAEADDAIGAAKERARRNGVPLSWSVAPDNAPTDLAKRLTASGFSPSAKPPGMALDLAGFAGPALPVGVNIATSVGEADAQTWRDTFTAGFGFPSNVGDAFFPLARVAAAHPAGDLSNYLLSLDGRCVAAGSLMMTGDVAGIYNVATVPALRRQGLGAALTTHLLNEGRKRGAVTAVLQSSTAGVGLYRELGFEVCFHFEQFVWRP